MPIVQESIKKKTLYLITRSSENIPYSCRTSCSVSMLTLTVATSKISVNMLILPVATATLTVKMLTLMVATAALSVNVLKLRVANKLRVL